MEHRDYTYYEAHTDSINLEEITSSAENAKILQQLRDGDPTLSSLSLGGPWYGALSILFPRSIDVSEENDWGWLGYFIGRSECLHNLSIEYLPEGEEGHAFVEGIARSLSIREIRIKNLNNDGFTRIMRASHSLFQLEGLTIWGDSNIGSDGWSELETLLESGVCKLKRLNLHGNNNVGNEGVHVLSNGLRGIGSSLKELVLEHIIIGNEGLSTLVEALQICTSLRRLDLSRNDFSSATADLSSLSDWLLRDEVNLNQLDLSCCAINDEGLNALAEVVANQVREISLFGNRSITATGLSNLSNSIQSDSCRVESLDLGGIPIGDAGLEVLSQGLSNNQSLTGLYLGDLHDNSVTSTGWLAFCRALCDTSSVNSTYLSNHTIYELNLAGGDDEEFILPRDILQLHEQHPQYAARCKILMKHPHLHMQPFLQSGLKFLPLAVAWFETAIPCTTLTIHDEDLDSRMRVLEESREAFESRALTALYEFIRGMPMEVMRSRHGLAVATAYDKRIARIEEENKIALEQRDVRHREASEQLYERYREALEQRDERHREASEQLYERYREALEQRDERYREALEQRDRKNLRLEEEIARLKGENERLGGCRVGR